MARIEQKAGNTQGVLIIAAAVMPVMAIISLIPVLPLLEKEFADVPGSEYLVPAALTVPAFCLAIFSPAAGWIADRVGRKSLLVASLVLYAALGSLPYFLTDLKQIIAARFVLGMTEAVIMTVATTLIGDYFHGKERERWLGVQVAAISIAAIVLVAIGGMLGQTLGSRGPFLMYLVALPLALLCAILLFEPTKSNENEGVSTESLPLARLSPLLLGGFILGVLFYVIIVKLGDILALKTTPNPALIGSMSAIINVGVVLGALTFGALKSRLSGSSIMGIGTVLIAIGYAVIPSAPNVPVTVFGGTLVCIGAGILIPTFLTWMMSLLTIAVRGRGTGIWQGSFFLGQFIAPIAVVALSKPMGGLAPTLYLLTGLAIALGTVSLLTKKSSTSLTEQVAAAT